jgi:hypothetical protein
MKSIFSMKPILVLLVIAAIVAAFAAHRSHLESVNAPLAVGLRGANRVSKPMSQRQRDRFETHFLETPATPRPTSTANVPPAVAQTQAINAFNQKQNR